MTKSLTNFASCFKRCVILDEAFELIDQTFCKACKHLLIGISSCGFVCSQNGNSVVLLDHERRRGCLTLAICSLLVTMDSISPVPEWLTALFLGDMRRYFVVGNSLGTVCVSWFRLIFLKLVYGLIFELKFECVFGD